MCMYTDGGFMRPYMVLSFYFDGLHYENKSFYYYYYLIRNYLQPVVMNQLF